MPSRKPPAAERPKIAPAMLRWYAKNARTLPWRIGPGADGPRADPYRVWLSEIMLQQTTVATVRKRYAEFIDRWPRVEALAAAPAEDVLGAWAGLGYYARARNLHKCARVIADELDGDFPATEEGLRALPGVGAYTAAAIAAIAFDARAVVVDGNIERLVSRVFAVETPLPAAKSLLKKKAGELWPAKRSGDFAQALMDLGATICTPRNPACGDCPISRACAAFASGAPAAFPRRAKKTPRPTRRGAAFVLSRGDGAVLLRRRPEKGLLGGMLEVASTPWAADFPADPMAHAPAKAKWERAARIAHTFTHFHLELDVWRARVGEKKAQRIEGLWTHEPATAGLPTVMLKVINAADNQRAPDGGQA